MLLTIVIPAEHIEEARGFAREFFKVPENLSTQQWCGGRFGEFLQFELVSADGSQQTASHFFCTDTYIDSRGQALIDFLGTKGVNWITLSQRTDPAAMLAEMGLQAVNEPPSWGKIREE